jgi:hypothetical protein
MPDEGPRVSLVEVADLREIPHDADRLTPLVVYWCATLIAMIEPTAP